MAIPGLRVNPLGVVVLAATVLLGLWYFLGSSSPVSSPVTSTYESRVDLKDLLTLGILLVEQAGKEVAKVKVSQQLNAEAKGKTREGATELITEADRVSHLIITNGFAKAYPKLQIISEERNVSDGGSRSLPTGSERGKTEIDELATLQSQSFSVSDVTVWVDPLDATQEYTESKGSTDMHKFVTIMICVAVKGKPTIGIVRRPLENDEYGQETVWAWKNNGHSKNLKPSTSDASDLPFIISRSHSGDVKQLIKKAFSDKAVVEAGGSGYKVLQVCRGKSLAYVHKTAIKKWDICAGNAIIDEVGGAMTTLKGETIDYSASSNAAVSDGLLVAKKQHGDLLKKLQDSVQEQDNVA